METERVKLLESQLTAHLSNLNEQTKRSETIRKQLKTALKTKDEKIMSLNEKIEVLVHQNLRKVQEVEETKVSAPVAAPEPVI